MAVKIRLRRMGTLKKPFYRIVVADSRSPRDGRFLEILGTYDPKISEKSYCINSERLAYWLSVGAQPSDTVKSFIKKEAAQAKQNA